MDTRVTQATAETISIGEVIARVSQSSVEALSSSPCAPRITQVFAESLSTVSIPPRVTQVLAEVLSKVSIPIIPSTPMVRFIRRVRQSPQLSDEALWLYYHEFQLDLETGRALSVGVDVTRTFGTDPTIMLQWSDDGGKTWSEEQWVSAGRQGQYAWRAIWRRLGKSRDRVWRVAVSDPVPWRITDAYVAVGREMSER